MRYTLRLLTLDQLSRAATMICALELARRDDVPKLGPWPFEIGLWVGISGSAVPYARRTVWSNADLHKQFPIFKEVATVFEGGIDPFPMPSNLLAQEYQDAFGQELDKYLDGKEDWTQMFGHADKALQTILDQPRP